MIDLEKTHPSLRNCRYSINGVIQTIKYPDGVTEFLFRWREVQKYTIDKSIVERDYISKAELKEMLDGWYTNNIHTKRTIQTLKLRLFGKELETKEGD